jgi:hypothetical protein
MTDMSNDAEVIARLRQIVADDDRREIERIAQLPPW